MLTAADSATISSDVLIVIPDLIARASTGRSPLDEDTAVALACTSLGSPAPDVDC